MESIKLKNGTRVILVRNRNLKSVNISAVFNVGIKDEDEKLAGISHLIEHLICQDKSLNKKLEPLGTGICGYIYKETTRYFLRVLKDDFRNTFDIFIKSLLEFKPNQNDIKKEKKIILEEITSRRNDYFIAVDNFLERTIYPSSYMGKETTGNPVSLKKITKKDIEGYYQKYYNPRNLTICLVGGIDPNIKRKVIQVIQKYQNRTKLDSEKKKEISRIGAPQKNIFVKKNKSRLIEAAVGFKGFNIFDEKKYLLRLLSIILTGAYNSRLFKKIREKEGLVYYLESFCVEYIKSGYLEIKFKTTKNNLQKALTIIGKEIEKMKEKGIIEKELTQAKKTFKCDTILRLENPLTLSEHLAEEMASIGRNIDTEKELFKIIDKIKSNDILEIVPRIFNKGNIYVSLIGDVVVKKGDLIKMLS